MAQRMNLSRKAYEGFNRKHYNEIIGDWPKKIKHRRVSTLDNGDRIIFLKVKLLSADGKPYETNLVDEIPSGCLLIGRKR